MGKAAKLKKFRKETNYKKNYKKIPTITVPKDYKKYQGFFPDAGYSYLAYYGKEYNHGFGCQNLPTGYAIIKNMISFSLQMPFITGGNVMATFEIYDQDLKKKALSYFNSDFTHGIMLFLAKPSYEKRYTSNTRVIPLIVTYIADNNEEYEEKIKNLKDDFMPPTIYIYSKITDNEEYTS